MAVYNPSVAGSMKGSVLTLAHRQQWLGFEGAPKTQLLSFHTPLSAGKAGIGMVLSRQRLGISSQVSAGLSYAYAIQLKEKTSLRVGLQALVNQYKLDLTSNAVVIESSGDPTINQGDFLDNTTANIGVGFLLNIEERFLIGCSVPRMLPASLLIDLQDKTLLTNRPHYYISLSGKWKLYGDNAINQAFLIKMLPGQLSNIDAQTSLFLGETVTAGLNIRLSSEMTLESAALFCAYTVNKELDFGLAYDIGLSKLRSQHAGSVELMVNYLFKKKEKTVVRGTAPRPRYF